MEVVRKEIEICGKTLRFETGHLALQANAACLVTLGDTTVLVTATMSQRVREDIDFFPLVCDFEEKLYAAGKIPGGFIKREGRPSERAILTSRLIDRPMRPLFPKGMRNDVQIVATPLSVDMENQPDVAAVTGASMALTLSDIPFDGPVGCVRVAWSEESGYVVNPTYKEMENARLEIVAAGTKDSLVMIESKGQSVSEEIIVGALKEAQEPILKLIAVQEKFAKETGKPKKEVTLYAPKEEIVKKTKSLAEKNISDVLHSVHEKAEREDKLNAIEKDLREKLLEEFPEQEQDIRAAFQDVMKKCVRALVLEDGVRPDGRKYAQVRPISSAVGAIPRVHGSGVFTRGETQVLTIVTLGALGEEQMLDGLGVEESKRYMHQYNFPPFSVGEVRPLRGPGRREIGHGALAEKALEVVIPDEKTFPYTIRLVSEVLSSNGSTSMASVCGSTLALMDAGVPIASPVSGIAMGMFSSPDKTVVVSDIAGIEDAFGDMDFKVAGTKDGVTALQLDVKCTGLTLELLSSALQQAKEGRLHILSKMLEAIPEVRSNLSPYAPRIFTLHISPDKIGEVIGAGGKVIKKIVALTEAKVDIEDDGSVFIYAVNEDAAKKAAEIVETITKEVKEGEVYTGHVTRILDFGAFVEITPGFEGLTSGKEGLVHISELSYERVGKVTDAVNIGDEVTVKVIKIDEFGRINLSKKALLPVPEGYQPPEPREHRGPRGGGGSHRPGGRGGHHEGKRR